MRSPGDARIGSFISRFDLLHLDARDLRRRPIEERKTPLRQALDDVCCARLVYVDHIVGRGANLFEPLHGISAEAAASPRGENRGCAGWVRSIEAQPRGAGVTVVQCVSEPSQKQLGLKLRPYIAHVRCSCFPWRLSLPAFQL
jgi:hypothetical protein